MDEEALKNNPDFHLKVLEGLEELRVSNRNDIRGSQIEAMKSANRVVADLNKYLITVATLLVPIIFSLINVKEIKEQIDQKDSAYIASSLAFLIISISTGFIHMVSEIDFFMNWLRNAEKKLSLWTSSAFWPGVPLRDQIAKYISEYEELRTKSNEIESTMAKESPKIFLILQGLFLVIGVIFLIIVTLRNLP